ncbi:MAG: VOC family protein [Opitutaceae bacterium]|nr:VOC family protein [Opitutaceae bacterium]
MRPISLPNTVDYVESPSRDLPKTKAFFSALLGWQFTEYGPEYLDYSDGRTTGGFYRSEKVSSYEGGSTIAVIYTERLEELRDRAKELGATITRDIFSFPGGRRFHFTEPGGSEFAAWSDK